MDEFRVLWLNSIIRYDEEESSTEFPMCAVSYKQRTIHLTGGNFKYEIQNEGTTVDVLKNARSGSVFIKIPREYIDEVVNFLDTITGR